MKTEISTAAEESLWLHRMRCVCASARVFSDLNVIDIEFRNGHTREVYVAASPAQRQRGLAEVSLLDADGMLFVYEQPSAVPFDVSRMLIDIDVAWFDATGALLKTVQVAAGDSAPLCCESPFSYVLEVPAGTLPTGGLKFQ